MNLRSMVTGGGGFIGSHLVDRLLADGHEVVVVDDFSVGRPSNLAGQRDNPRLSVHAMSVNDGPQMRDLMRGVQWVFHLAGLADIVPSIENPRAYFDANVAGTVAVLEAARDSGVRRLVYSASSSCYGIPDVYPTPESAPARPQYPYALTKYLGEQCVMHWGQVYDLPVVSLRFFNVFGPRARTSGTYGAVFGVFLAQKLHGKPLTIVGDGTQTRDFTYVTDVVDAVVTAAGSDVRQEIMNVGSGDTYSVNRLADLVGGPRVHIPKRPGEPDVTFADTTRIRTLLGWAPKVSFEEGVGRVLACIEDWRDAPVWTSEAIEEKTRAWFEHLDPQPDTGR
jgi:UDP-glucose 4-epimerase